MGKPRATGTQRARGSDGAIVTDIQSLREAIELVHHGVEAMPDGRAKSRLSSELDALRSEIDRWAAGPIPEGAPESVRRRVMSLQLVVSKI